MNLNLVAPINYTSYGLTSANITHELSKKGVNLGLFPIGGLQFYPHHRESIVKSMGEPAQFYDPDAPCVRLYHQFSLHKFVGRGKKIGYTIFELDTFKDVEKHHIESIDEVWVCSQWAKEVVHNQTSQKNVKIVPLGIDPNVFTPQPARQSDDYIFFNIGKIEYRKGHDLIPELFLKAFPNEKDVKLVMGFSCLISKPEQVESWKNHYRNLLGDRVEFLDRLPTQDQLAGFIGQFDCGLFPSRAEGWNLPLLETICCNRPVITTNYSAHTEFCTQHNSFLVDVNKVEKAYDGRYFHGDGNWAKIGNKEKDDFISLMRECYYNGIRHNQGCDGTRNTFTWENSASKILEHLNDGN